ncbi:MAG: hypothetical protein ACPGR2_14255 [Psychrobium sp.]
MNLKLLTASLFLIVSHPSLAQANNFTVENNVVSGAMTPLSSDDLCDVASGTINYLDKGKAYDGHANHPGISQQFGGDLARIKATLAFICIVNQQDKKAGRQSRLHDINFINRHFEMVRWLPDQQQVAKFSHQKPLLQNIPDGHLLLTKYYIKKAKGSAIQSESTPHALYQIPHDEASLTLEQADAKKDHITRYQYTKQQVLSGVLDKKALAEPMVWLSRSDLEDTLMQGTVMIEDAAGNPQHFFNVDRNNGIAYDRNLKKEQQGRYWYFKKTQSVLGYGKDASYKIPIKPLVTVAGDLAHLGLGKLIMLSHNNQHRLVVLADTGGAFEKNQYQLDYLGGYFYNWGDYINTYRHFPDYFEARILLLKEEVSQ